MHKLSRKRKEPLDSSTQMRRHPLPQGRHGHRTALLTDLFATDKEQQRRDRLNAVAGLGLGVVVHVDLDQFELTRMFRGKLLQQR